MVSLLVEEGGPFDLRVALPLVTDLELITISANFETFLFVRVDVTG